MSAPAYETMYLHEFRAERFRSCADVTVKLQPALTLIVGENNAGKSNIIDALRLATLPLSGRRTRYFDAEDKTRHHEGPIVLTAEFRGLSKFQRGQYVGALDIESGSATFTTLYHLPDEKNPRGRVDQLAGVAPAPDSEPDKRDQLNHVYLEPLRDAQRELDSASSSRLALIMKYLIEPAEQEEFIEHARRNLEELSGHEVVTRTNKSIQDHLSGLTDGVRGQRVGMAFDTPELHRLTRSLRLKMSEHGVDLADLSASGLGYANLLYLSTVILELQKVKASELTLFLVEEPEAHLHPQLQAVLLDYLRDQAEKSVADDSSGPAGRIQIVATTHSPNLASAVGIENVIVLRSVARTDGQGDAPAPQHETAALTLSALKLSPDDQRKINQYLDATRSELLFTRRAVLVEGVSEAVLLPALAKNCVLAGDDEPSKLARRSFRGTSVISVGSVDFLPYMRLMLAEVGGVRLVDRLVVVTDGDPDLELGDDGEGDDLGDDKPIYNRAADLRRLGAELNAEAVLHVAEAPHTLEADLLVSGTENHKVLGQAFLAQRKRSSKRWEAIIADEDPARAFYRDLRDVKRLISKGQFAHDVAQAISAGKPFSCPSYLVAAVKHVVGDVAS